MIEDYNYNLGTEFERALILWLIKNEPEYEWAKPDILNCTTGDIIEAKCTRPYYDESPDDNPNAKDLGTGLPYRQFKKYKTAVNNGTTVFLVHKMTEGKYLDRIFWTQMTTEFINKGNFSYFGDTVYWLYEDLNLTKLEI